MSILSLFIVLKRMWKSAKYKGLGLVSKEWRLRSLLRAQSTALARMAKQIEQTRDAEVRTRLRDDYDGEAHEYELLEFELGHIRSKKLIAKATEIHVLDGWPRDDLLYEDAAGGSANAPASIQFRWLLLCEK